MTNASTRFPNPLIDRLERRTAQWGFRTYEARRTLAPSDWPQTGQPLPKYWAYPSNFSRRMPADGDFVHGTKPAYSPLSGWRQEVSGAIRT